MRHFSKDQWKLYCESDIEATIRMEMEEHLLHCNDCTEIYLSLMENSNFGNSIHIISEEFTEKIIKELYNKKLIKLQKKNSRSKASSDRINRFIYYTAVASVTIFFMSCGVFEHLENRLSLKNFGSNSVNFINSNIKKDTIIRYGWSEDLVNKTSSFMNSFIPNKKE